MKHRLFVLVVLGVAAHANAGAVIELVPDDPGPFFPGQVVSVEVWLHNDDAVGHDLRLVALDVRALRERLLAGGDFTTSGAATVDHVAKLSADSWVPVGGGMDGPVYALASLPGGSPPNLFAGGLFDTAGGQSALNIAQWNGYAWSEVGGGTPGRVHSLLSWDDGTGTALYLAGWPLEVDGVPTKIARWDGDQWATFRNLNSGVLSMAVFDDGTGPALYAGGTFPGAMAPPSFEVLNRVARSDGWDWEPLGYGVMFGFDIWAVRALTVFDDGGGPALYVGGDFTRAFRAPDDYLIVNKIARWDGTDWSEVGGGVNPGAPGPIYDMIVFDDGSGPALYVGGRFTTAGGVGVSNIARWDGASWSDVGGGVTGGEDAAVRALAIFDDGTGPALHVGGLFTSAGGVPVSNVAKWDGVAWSAVGDGLDDTVRALAVADDSGEPGPTLDPIFQFDFSTLSDSGEIYFQVPDLPRLSVAYMGMDPIPGSILHLPAAGSLRIGTLGLALPSTPGDYTVDVATLSSPGGGAQVQFGFGIDPGDPVTVWTTASGDLTGGAFTFEVPRESGQPIPTVSEWGMIVMALLVLTTGTLVCMRRRPATG